MATEVHIEDATREPSVKAYLDSFPSIGWIDLDFRRYGPEGILLPRGYAKWASSFRNMQVRPDDVWVVTFPKCGTTWTQEMVWLICNNSDFVKAKELPLTQRFPMLEIDAIQETGTSKTAWQLVSEMASPRFIKTHLPPSLLPKQLETVKPKIVATLRNPMDACVSFFHHHVTINGYKGSLDDFVKAFASDAVAFAPYWEMTKALEALSSEPNVLLLTFEDMKADLGAVLKKVAKFFDVQLTSEQVSDLAAHLCFDKMKTNKSVNWEFMFEFSKGRGWQVPEGASFIRKGKVGSWREEMSEESVLLMKEWVKAKGIQGLYEV